MDKKEEFCLVDLWAAEAYLTALDARAENLLEMLNKGIKIHQWMQDQTKEKFPDGAKNYSYKDAKQSVHALNYGIRPPQMSVVSGLPINICEWQFNLYHTKFPGIKLRQARIKQRLIHDRFLVSLLGKKRYFLGPLNDELYKQAYAWPSQSCIGELTIIALSKVYAIGDAKNLAAKLGKDVNVPWCYPALNTHDGLAIRCWQGEREAVRAVVKDAFDIPLTVDGETIVIPVEIGWGANFQDISGEEVIRYE